MEESFDLVAQTRANYYTPNSPVQFVRVELLKGNVSGDRAVCLTFKNISRVTLTALDIKFKCKGSDGAILCEDEFQYRELNVKPGELFGMDDAVFITQKGIGSVDVVLKNVYNENRVVELEKLKRVRLPAPRRLPDDLQAALEERMGRGDMKYAPQVLDNGWYCACGAFHPKEEDTVYCSECGCDRILLQNALNTLMQPEVPEPQAEEIQIEPEEEPTRIVSDKQAAVQAADDGTRAYRPKGKAQAADSEAEGHTRVVVAEAGKPEQSPVLRQTEAAAPARRNTAADVQEDEDDEEQDALAEGIIRWVPPVTALICAAIALCGFVYYQFFL